jgi:hypothetical protein
MFVVFIAFVTSAKCIVFTASFMLPLMLLPDSLTTPWLLDAGLYKYLAEYPYTGKTPPAESSTTE